MLVQYALLIFPILAAFGITSESSLVVEEAPKASAPPPIPAITLAQVEPRLWPIPTKWSTGDKVICLAPDFAISYDDVLAAAAVPKDLQAAVAIFQKSIKQNRHSYLSPSGGMEFFSNSSSSSYGPHEEATCDSYLQNLVIGFECDCLAQGKQIHSIFENSVRPTEERPELEAYHLSVPMGETATLRSKSAVGLYRGLTTFEQLFYHLPISASSGNTHIASGTGSPSAASAAQAPMGGSSTGLGQTDGQGHISLEEIGKLYAPHGPYEIEDKPAFGWRAVSLDTSRNWFGIPAILKMLDTMSMVKLNVFHWHITDSNSWPLDLSAFPELAEKGAYSPQQKYSEEQVRMIVEYAGERGIDVLVEIDTPGHTAIIAESHPEHIACYKAPFSTNALQPPSGQLRFASPETAEFTRQIFEATLGLVSSQYFSTGGDELNTKCMMEDPETISALEANGWTLNDALNDFTERTHKALHDRGKTPVVWQEMVLDHGPMTSLSKDTIVDIWKSSDVARDVLDKGHRIVHAPADFFYLDCGQGGWIAKEGGGNSWCDPFKSWARMYSFNPYDNVAEEQKPLVLGGQACLWAEQTDEANVEQVMWPRAAVIGEIFWSGAGGTGYPRSSVAALPRMHDIRYRMIERGVKAVPLQPHWCALRPEQCVEGM